MNLTPSTVRTDLKCGNGAISEGEKCHKGQASRIKTAAKVALGAGVGALALSANSFRAGSRTGHLTHGHKANPSLAGGLANAAVPAVLGAVAGGALTAGALTMSRRRNQRRQSSTSQGLEKGTTKQLVDHRNQLYDELIRKYKKPINNEKDLDAFNKWAAKQPLQQEIDAVNTIIQKRQRSRTDAAGKPCGQSHIAAGKQCQQKGSFPTRKAIAAGLGVAAIGVGAYALHRRNRIQPVQVSFGAPAMVQPGSPRPSLPGDRTTRRLRGTTPKGLLPPSPPRQSKTARMRANTGAAARLAERRIAQTAREEVRRIAQIGNTMAAAGEATGMAAKTGWREVRLRVEAARRRYEPGYRRGQRFQTPPLLPGSSADPLRIGLTPRSVSPQRVRIRRSDALPGKSSAW